MTVIARSLTASPLEAVRAALANLLALRQRSALALLGIVIGTASVVAMMTVGRMAEAEALRLFDKMGVDVLLATTSGGDPSVGLDPKEVERLPQRLSLAVAATSLAMGHVAISSAKGEQGFSTVAATSELLPFAKLEIAQGRFLAKVDADNFIAVEGAEVPATLWRAGVPAGLGKPVQVGDYLFQVVGILRPREMTAFDPTNFNRSIFIPLDLRSRPPDHPAVNVALIRAQAGVDPRLAVTKIQAELKPAVAGVQVQVRSAQQLVSAIEAQKAVQTQLLAAIGAISLLVGGIGVMNVMLMGVMERQGEIGLRAAIGATPADIQLMFLVEAGILALVGGLAGAVLGIATTAAVAKAAGWVFTVYWFAIPLGAGMAAMVGIFFGLYPAVKASRLNPVNALRAD